MIAYGLAASCDFEEAPLHAFMDRKKYPRIMADCGVFVEVS